MKCIKTAICEDCQNTLLYYGEPCLDACILACMGMTSGIFATYDPEKDIKIQEIIMFLENKSYLLSSELSKKQIAFIPTCEPSLKMENIFLYCWCELNNLEI